MMLTKRSTLGAGALIALALLFVGLTILFSHLLSGWRLDLTENKLYSTAPGTVRILKNLKEPINLYFFFSEKASSPYPTLKTYGTRVREFLEELAARSQGNIRLQVIDPEPFSEDEDRASELGVRGMPSATAGGPPIYFGLAATNSTDGKATIDFFDPNKEEFLEYDVVKLVYQLANPKKPVVGWISGIPITPVFDPQSGRESSPPVVYSQAQQLFELRTLGSASLTEKDLADLAVLVIVHPKDLPLPTQFAIDQYALRGGHIIVFVDPLAEQDPAGRQQQQYMAQGQMMDPGNADTSSHLEKLFEAWGIEFDNRKVVGDLELAMQVGMRPGAPPVRHLGILGLDQRSFDKKDVVTAGLSNINVATAGFVAPRKGGSVKFEPLLQTSISAAPIPKERFNPMMMYDPSSLMDGFTPTGQRYTIAARVSGKVKTAFPGGAPTGVTLPEGQRPLTQSAKPLALIVTADTDMLADFMWVRVQNFFGSQMAQAFANNGDFMFNALDNLAGSEDLISVRGRATFTRPFVVVNKLRANAESRFRAKEQELESQLSETEQKLSQLESKRDEKSSGLILTPEQERELDRFQQEKLRIRKELRAVRLGLDQEIKGLGTKLKFLNIVVVPLAFALLALAVVAWRNQKRARVAAGGSR
jgi:ABC-type uncharacterized transport system involved in gliding motility auxiliary subunit